MNHNKKRNATLLYEFLVIKIAKQLIEDNSNSIPLDLLKKYFRPGTELFKELRLMQALLDTTVSSESLASSIIQEAKSAVKSHDAQRLDKEKSFLLKEINHKINDQYFFDQPILDYKMHATVQLLLNEWRLSSVNDMAQLIKLESTLHSWLLTDKQEKKPSALIEGSLGMNRLLVKTMTKKLNDKYKNVLLFEQKELLRTYMLYMKNNNKDLVLNVVKEIQDKALASIDGYLLEEKKDHVVSKLNAVKQQIMSENMDIVDDLLVSKFMAYVKLVNEIRESRAKS